MSTYPAPELLRLWVLNEVTPEQTIGHLLQHLVTLSQRLADLEKQLHCLEQQVAAKAKATPAGLIGWRKGDQPCLWQKNLCV